MKGYIYIFLILLSLGIVVTSWLTSKEIKRRPSEHYILLNKLVFIPVPRDIQYGLADINFANTVSYIGYSLSKHNGHISKEDGLIIYVSLDAVTFYNPRYFDPYYVANAFLTWELGMYEEVINLLKRGMRFINDWRLPFYIGFIYFYFLGDNLNGAKYIALSVKYKKDNRSNLATLLASRLYYEEGKIELAISILKEQIKIIKDEDSKKALKIRLTALESALGIYKAMKLFKSRFGRYPTNISELEKLGFIPSGLKDPLGGRFYITQDGKVRSEKVLFPIKRKMIERERKR